MLNNQILNIMKTLIYNGFKFKYNDFKFENLGFAFEVKLLNNNITIAKLMLSKKQLQSL